MTLLSIILSNCCGFSVKFSVCFGNGNGELSWISSTKTKVRCNHHKKYSHLILLYFINIAQTLFVSKLICIAVENCVVKMELAQSFKRILGVVVTVVCALLCCLFWASLVKKVLENITLPVRSRGNIDSTIRFVLPLTITSCFWSSGHCHNQTISCHDWLATFCPHCDCSPGLQWGDSPTKLS